MKNISINGREIGPGCQPYVIAEMSGNHNQSFENAISIVRSAAASGADAIKLQTYTPDIITIDSSLNDFVIKDKSSLWYGKSLYELYTIAHTPWEWIGDIIEEARNHKIECFSSVFDESGIDFLEDLGVNAYKISSFENNHLPLIRKAAKTKKPLIISTGASSESDIIEAVENARDAGCEELALLKCTSSYPAKFSDANLLSIPWLREKFQCVVGLSDHTSGIAAAIGSVVLGASIIEKHFIVSRDHGGVDSSFSADESEFGKMIMEIKNAWWAIGEPTLRLSEEEKKSLMFKRSIYAVSQIKKGEIFNRQNIKVVRPGFGLHPRHFDEVLGKPSARELNPGERIDKTCF